MDNKDCGCLPMLAWVVILTAIGYVTFWWVPIIVALFLGFAGSNSNPDRRRTPATDEWMAEGLRLWRNRQP
ncbi:hypothetical protein [Magnetospirillum moscoviense]|uniref:hypothetical protein n=1 Tax=Magnetospirillum moscoviense TaxID=1437059 RepID=UPI0012E7C36E|nr:hypothetical protein [Magnetospirillum moscoviense]